MFISARGLPLIRLPRRQRPTEHWLDRDDLRRLSLAIAAALLFGAGLMLLLLALPLT